MAKITAEHQEEFRTLPDDSIVQLKVEDCNPRDVPGRDGKDGWTKLEFKFKILGVQATGDGSPISDYESLIGENIWGSVPFRLNDSAENKLRIWCEALLDMEIGVGFELDTDYLLGRSCRGITSSYERSKAQVSPVTGKKPRSHQIESLLKAGNAPAPQQQAPVDPWATSPTQAPQAQLTGADVPANHGSWEAPPF